MGYTGGLVTGLRIEEKFRQYLISCEYLQIDPSKVYEWDFVQNRIEILRNHFDKSGDTKRMNELLNWFEEYYPNDPWGYNFIKKSAKLVRKGKLIIHEGTVSETFVVSELTQKNCDHFSRNDMKVALILIVASLLVFFLYRIIFG